MNAADAIEGAMADDAVRVIIVTGAIWNRPKPVLAPRPVTGARPGAISYSNIN